MASSPNSPSSSGVRTRGVHAWWYRAPIVVRAPVTGLVAAAAGTMPWAALVALNLKYASKVPWAVPPMAVYLWFYWRYVRGAGWPRSTAAARHATSRANRLSDDVWGMAILAGVLGLTTVILIQGVTGRLVTLPQQHDIDPSLYPLGTVMLWVVMSAIVAGVVEETAFRGYMQRPIEQRHGPVVAILLTGGLFGFVHFTHPEVTLALLPFYLAVAAVYGALAYVTDSILPSMVLHASGNVLGAIDLFTRGRSEWQATAEPKPTVWQTGVDASFWGSLAALVVLGTVTVFAYRALAQVARAAHIEARDSVT